MSSCNCNFCKMYGRVNWVMDGCGSVERELIWHLYERAMYSEDDLAYYKAILDGSWPHSVEILERALEKAKKKVENDKA